MQDLTNRINLAISQGIYFKESNPSEYTLLNADGTFVIFEYGKEMKGLFSIDKETITLQVGIKAATGTYKGDYIIDDEGNKWLKK